MRVAAEQQSSQILETMQPFLPFVARSTKLNQSAFDFTLISFRAIMAIEKYPTRFSFNKFCLQIPVVGTLAAN